MSRFLSKRFAGMSAYVPGEQPQNRQYVKLNTNESPFPPAPGVIRALDATQAGMLNLYPDPDTRDAGDVISGYFGLKRENIVLGNGSDELLSFCFQAFCDEQVQPCFPEVSYGFYKVFARIFCLQPKLVKLDANLQLKPEDFYEAGATVVLANPNAPTGQAFSPAEIEGILQRNKNNVVVVDEAYVDFGAESCVPLIGKYDNLIIIQTMSKARNLAGARLGYALGCPALMRDVNSMKFSFNPSNVNRLSLIAGIEAVKDEAYFRRCTGAIMQTRAETVKALEARGFAVLPSRANFIFAKPAKLSGSAYYQKLKELGVLVRHFDDPQLTDYVRITIGSPEQMQALLRATDELLAEA